MLGVGAIPCSVFPETTGKTCRDAHEASDRAEGPGQQETAESKVLLEYVLLGPVMLQGARKVVLCGAASQVREGDVATDEEPCAEFSGSEGEVGIFVIHEDFFVEQGAGPAAEGVVEFFPEHPAYAAQPVCFVKVCSGCFFQVALQYLGGGAFAS